MSRPVLMMFVYLFEMIISFCFFTRIYEKKQKSNFLIILIGLLLFLPSSFIFSLFENEIINLIVFFAINFIFALLCFDISVKNAAIQSIILDTLMFSTETITVFNLPFILNVQTDEYKNNVYTLMIGVIICKLAYFILSQLLSLIIIKIGHKNNKIKQFLPLFIFPVLTILSCTIFLFIALEFEVSTSYKIATTAVCILYIIASIFIFIYYQILANREEKINELESEKRLYNLNQTYLDVL